MIRVLEELAEPSRRRLLELLLDGPVSVSGLVLATGLKQPNVSNHLARLRSRGIVRASKVGRQVFYSLASLDVERLVRQAGLEPESKPSVSLELSSLAEEFATAASIGDEAACGELLDRVLRSGCSLLDVYEDLLGAAMAIVGDLYREGKITVAGEHMASEITERSLARTSHFFGHRSSNDFVALLGCAPGGQHVIGLRMIGDYLNQRGWRTIYLGSDVPTSAFVATVRHNRPGLVLLACHSKPEIAATLDLIRELAAFRAEALRGGFLIVVGGTVVAREERPFREAGADLTSPRLRTFATETLPKIESELTRLGEGPHRQGSAPLDGDERG